MIYKVKKTRGSTLTTSRKSTSTQPTNYQQKTPLEKYIKTNESNHEQKPNINIHHSMIYVKPKHHTTKHKSSVQSMVIVGTNKPTKV